MPYSKAAINRAVKRAPWPDIRYNLATGEAKLFNRPEDVPRGWVTRSRGKLSNKQIVVYDKQDMINKLTNLGVQIDPRWGLGHLKKVLDDVSSSR